VKAPIQNCQRWHPGVPSDWSDYERKKAGVVIGVRRVCLECNRSRCRSYYHQEGAPAPIEEAPVIGNYGVLPRLIWAPPSI
jgi:hypothetical protein